jgi:hypothetical protein
MPTEVHPHYHGHHHHHEPGEGHPPAAISPSILRLSAAERLAAAGVLIAVIWAVVFWAMAWPS